MDNKKYLSVILCISVLSGLSLMVVVFVRMPEVIVVPTDDNVFMTSWYILVLAVVGGNGIRMHEYWTQDLGLYAHLRSENEDRRLETRENAKEIKDVRQEARMNRSLIDNTDKKVNKIIDTGGHQR
jgi:hypothetical protein